MLGLKTRNNQNEINENGFGAFKYSFMKPEDLVERLLSTICGEENLAKDKIKDMDGCFENTGTFDVSHGPQNFSFDFLLG